MGSVHSLSNSVIPLTRDQAERITEWLRDTERNCALLANALTDRFDLDDGDADDETCRTEDDFTPMPNVIDFGAGCQVSDPPEDDTEDAEHDGREPELEV